jgi:processing peptidase subunit beta
MRSCSLKHFQRSFSSISKAIPQFGLWQPTYVTRLTNGLRVATQRIPDADNCGTLTLGVWINAGSRNETSLTNGTAHFLEHLAFKGTAKRSRIDLEKEIEDMGGQLNAYTSREQTTYFARVFKSDINQGLEILSDILLNSTYEKSAIEEERSVILRESQEVEKSFEEVLFDRIHMSAFR